MKVFLSILAVLAVLVGVFCGLYFGIPEVHDWFVNLFKPETTDAVEEGTQAVIRFLSLK